MLMDTITNNLCCSRLKMLREACWRIKDKYGNIFGESKPRQLIMFRREEEELLVEIGTALDFLVSCPPLNLLFIQLKNFKAKTECQLNYQPSYNSYILISNKQAVCKSNIAPYIYSLELEPIKRMKFSTMYDSNLNQPSYSKMNLCRWCLRNW